jgi:hypothetical protein
VIPAGNSSACVLVDDELQTEQAKVVTATSLAAHQRGPVLRPQQGQLERVELAVLMGVHPSR